METIELLRHLVRHDTTSHLPNQNAVDFLDGLLRGAGWAVAVQTAPSGGKANLFATLGPRDQGGLMLAGHLDVVPVAGQVWGGDPFTLRPVSDAKGAPRLVGRGTADMKGFIAQAVAVGLSLAHTRLKVPVHLAFTYDEEVGCLGAAQLVGYLTAAGGPLPRWALLGEPTAWQVYRMHKGMTMARVIITGVDGHSSRPALGVNAIVAGARLVGFLEDLAQRLAQTTDTALNLDPPHGTLSVGRIQGGTAYNIIPHHCEVGFEFRTLPGQDPGAVLGAVRAYLDAELNPWLARQNPLAGAVLEVVTHGPPMNTPAGGPLEAALLALTGQKTAGAAPYFTEGALYNPAGIPSIICGPGELAQAHRPDESISLAQLEAGAPLLHKLIDTLCR